MMMDDANDIRPHTEVLEDVKAQEAAFNAVLDELRNALETRKYCWANFAKRNALNEVKANLNWHEHTRAQYESLYQDIGRRPARYVSDTMRLVEVLDLQAKSTVAEVWDTLMLLRRELVKDHATPETDASVTSLEHMARAVCDLAGHYGIWVRDDNDTLTDERGVSFRVEDLIDYGHLISRPPEDFVSDEHHLDVEEEMAAAGTLFQTLDIYWKAQRRATCAWPTWKDSTEYGERDH
jgi:hypothetical protein